MRQSIIHDGELLQLVIAALVSGGILGAADGVSWWLALLVGGLVAVYACYVTREEIA